MEVDKMSKILFKALFPKFKVIEEIKQVEENKFIITTIRMYNFKQASEVILRELDKMGFTHDGDDLKITESSMTTKGTWACMETVVKFWDWGFKTYPY